MSYREELQNSPGYDDLNDREFAIKHALTFLGFELVSTPVENCDIDLRCKHDLSIGVDIERANTICGYDWWDSDNLHYSMISGFSFKTINIASRKHHYWEEYNKKTGIYNPSYNKNYLIRTTFDRSCVMVISANTILDDTKRHESHFIPRRIGYGKLEKFWCFKEEDVKTFLRQEDGTYKLKPYIKKDIDESITRKNDIARRIREESIRKSDMARRAREFHARKAQTN
jgi:hypothetical protein